MAMTKPSELRGTEIKSIAALDEDTVIAVLKNGNSVDLRVEDLIQDWLHLHKKLQQTKAWIDQARESEA
ncbi:MAG: hypothetical protein ACTSX8_03230 [Alphaproteobacteria bacterium]